MTPITKRELADLHPDLRGRVLALLTAAPKQIGITSAWRSPVEQQRLYDGWVKRLPGFNPANRPGTSKHERTLDGKPAAEAADLAVSAWGHWVHEHASDFGLHFPIRPNPEARTAAGRRGEPWHVESNGRPFSPTTSEEDEMTPADWANMNKLLDDKLRIVLRAEDSSGKPTSHPNLQALTEQLKALQPKLVTADGHKVCMVTPATGAVHVLSPQELAAWRALGVVSREAPKRITAEEMAVLEQAAEVRR